MPLWKDTRYEYDADDNVIYIGMNTKENANTSDSSWYLWKYEWLNGNLTRKQGPVHASWGSRANAGNWE